MAVDPLRIFGLLGGQDLAPDEDERPELGRAVEPGPPPPPESGTLFAERFRIKGSLGEGAFGDVLLATDETLNRDVAIKLLRRTTPQLRARFLREARATASLSHPNILAVFQVGEEGDRPYIVYELVPGARDLAAVFAERDLEGRLDLFEQALAGVAAAHAAGIVHRDLKPENILVQAPGRVYVADFGLAHVSESSLTNTGQFLGTPAYMAPEQVLGQETSAATDVWALGQIFYEVLYQETWIQDSLTIQELISRICAANFQSPASAPAGIPRPLENLLFREVLQRRKAQRLPDAKAFLERLQLLRNPPPKPAFAPWLFSGLVLLAGALGGAVVMGILRKSLSGPAPTPVLRSNASPSPTSSPAPSPVLTPTRSPLVAPSPSPISEPSLAAAVEPGRELPAYGTRTYFERRRSFMSATTEELQVEATRGDLAAMRILGRRLFLGWRITQDVTLGREWLTRAAEAGCPDSMEDLSRSYAHDTAPQDPELSARWEKRALEARSVGALLRRHANKGTGLPIREARAALAAGDDESAIRMAKYFAALGLQDRALDWTAGAIALGSISARGLRAQFAIQRGGKDYSQVIPDLEAGASAGSSIALQELARCQMLGRGVPKDLDRAERSLKMALAAGSRPADLIYFETLLVVRRSVEEKRGDSVVIPERAWRLAAGSSHYLKGELALLLLDLSKGPKSDLRLRQEAAKLFRLAKNSINPQSHVLFGLSIVRKDIPSDNPDLEACEAFRRAATLGSPYGYLNYGTALARGLGVKANVEEGIRYLELAAAEKVVRAHVNLGNLFLNRFRYPKHYDLERGLRNFEQAHQAGMPHVHRRAALRFKVEEGLHREALQLFEVALKQGDPVAAYHVAAYLLTDQAGPPDPERAVKLLQALPAKDWTPAGCKLLADCYAEGRGVEADPQVAQIWRDHAARIARQFKKKGR
jgi:eukaryotic-like serine/threonine-protein kinase